MTRAELVRQLNDLVRRKRITRAEADALLARYDAGEPVELPAAPESSNGEWLAAFALLLLLVRGNPRRRLTPQMSQRARRLLRGNFDSAMRSLANQVAGGALTVPAWQAQMQNALSGYVRQMAVAGRGRLPSPAMVARIEARLADQWPYLNRFALEQMARGMAGRPLTAAQIASRSRTYGATGWGAYFEAQGEDAEAGIVEQWISRDDRAVCRVCAPRHLQWFLPGQGPMPGLDCLGACRCERVPQYNPDVYAQLTGQRSAQRQAA